MTSKQKLFCDYYVASNNAKEAAKLAGYGQERAERTAKELLSKTEIKEYVAQQLKLKQREKVASEQEILEFLTSVLRNGTESTKDKLKAVTLLSKCCSSDDEDLKQRVIIIDDVPTTGEEYAKQEADT